MSVIIICDDCHRPVEVDFRHARRRYCDKCVKQRKIAAGKLGGRPPNTKTPKITVTV